MIGYGSENDHFVLELTYNYGIGSYTHGNDFRGIHIHSPEAFIRVTQQNDLPVTQHTDTLLEVLDPAGYRFFIYNETPTTKDAIWKVELAVSNLQRSLGNVHSFHFYNIFYRLLFQEMRNGIAGFH